MSKQTPRHPNTINHECLDQQSSAADHKLNRRFFKSFFFLILLLFFFTLGFTGKRYLEYLFLSEPERISFLWQRDIENLKKNGTLPEGMDQIGSIKFVSTSKLTKHWKQKIKLPFTIKKNGKYHLELLIIGLEEPDLRGAIIQMNLTTKKDDNHIWELGRTYSLKLTTIEKWQKQTLLELKKSFK